MFKAIFTGSAADSWRELAQQMGARYEANGLFGSDIEVVAQFHDWQIVLDHFTVSSGNSNITYSRIRAPCLNPRRFEMKVQRTNFIGRGFRKLFRQQDIAIGDATFDHDHVVTGNSEPAARRLLADTAVRGVLAAQKFSEFSLSHNDPMLRFKKGHGRDDVAIFRLTWLGKEKDQARLRRYFSLFEHTLLDLRALTSPQERPLELGEQPLLENTKATLLDELSWLSAVSERTADGLSSRLRLPYGSETYLGKLDVTAAVFPNLDCTIALHARIPLRHDPIEMRTPSGMTDTLANLADTKIGVPTLDDAFIIRAQPDSLPLLGACAESFEALLRFVEYTGDIRLRLEEESLTLTLSEVRREDVREIARLFAVIWKRICDQESGLRQLSS